MAEAYGVPVNTIFSTLQSELAAAYVNDFNLYGYSFKVKMQANADERSTLSDISQIMVRNNKGKMVPLSAFAEVKRTTGPRMITRFNQYMSAKITLNGKPGQLHSGAISVGYDCSKIHFCQFTSSSLLATSPC